MSDTDPKPARPRLPRWLRRRIPAAGRHTEVKTLLADLGLHTVCAGARCPNLCECFARGTATFLILGPTCSRSCRFCAVQSGAPAPPRADEPAAIAEAASRLDLRHVVITTVTRDDLPDGGAEHFAATIQAVRARRPGVVIEVLTSDFAGDLTALDTVLSAGANVLNHNMETVPRLYETVRPQADYPRSLDVLAHAAKWAAEAPAKRYVKSGLMLGLGEIPEELRQVLADLREAGCDILTLGQYLCPSSAHFPVARFIEPAEFDTWRDEALAIGFSAVASGPFVRSSYLAGEVLDSIAARAS